MTSDITYRNPTTRTDLELFLLALLQSGAFTTPFDLHVYAGISTGSSIPVLRRMERQGLVSRGLPMPRRRRDYAITPDGLRALESSWRSATVPYELRSILRLVWLARRFGDDSRAADVLKIAAAIRRSELEKLKLDLDFPAEALPRSKPEVVLRELSNMALHWERRRLEAEITALEELSSHIENARGAGDSGKGPPDWMR